jgi:hypothetical protein
VFAIAHGVLRNEIGKAAILAKCDAGISLSHQADTELPSHGADGFRFRLEKNYN